MCFPDAALVPNLQTAALLCNTLLSYVPSEVWSHVKTRYNGLGVTKKKRDEYNLFSTACIRQRVSREGVRILRK